MKAPLSRRSRVHACTCAVVLALLASMATRAELAAQDGAISGNVTSGIDGRPLEGAFVVVVGSNRSTLSGAGGAFHLVGLPRGAHVIEISFIGHQDLQHSVDIGSGPNPRLVLELPVEPVPLAGVDVEGRRSVALAMAGFFERRERATGFYFTADEIAAMQARSVTDVLRRVPGAEVQTMDGRYGSNQIVRMSRTRGAAGARECNAIYYLDGIPFPVTPEIGIDAYVAVRDVEGVEVYSGASRVPSRFNTGQLASRCGVIAIWTKV